MGTTTMAYAASAAASAAPASPLAVLVVTAVLLLLMGAAFWSFLRRARRRGGTPLAVDLLDAPRLPEPPSPTMLASEAAQEAAAIEDEIAEGGPVDGTEGRP